MAGITWTEEALRWLEDIFEYIAEDNPQAAAHTVQGIYNRAQELARFLRSASDFPPLRGTSVSSSTGIIGLLISSRMTGTSMSWESFTALSISVDTSSR